MSSTTIKTLLVIAAVLSVLPAVDSATAAPPPGTVTGLIKDSLERPIDAAQVRLEAEDGRVVARTTADDQGRFTFTGIAPGTYAVVGEKEGFELATAIVTVPPTEGTTAELTLASRKALDVKVAARRLEEARIDIQPRIGASTYEITSQAIENQPRGDNNSLTDILLQAPGVTQDASSVGGLHVRHQMGNIQYRINGVALPEGATLFGQSGGLSPRLASSVTLVTGALPAEYGLRTSGTFEIQTKSGAFESGGYVGMYGGSHGWLEPSAEYGGSLGRFSYFVTGDYLENNLGISPATPHGAIHDHTHQGHAFGYFEYLLDSTSKLGAVAGSFVGHFEIPNRQGATPTFTVNGISSFDSTKVDERQQEQNHFLVLSYLKAVPDFTVQVAPFVRYSTMTFQPDPVADLLFNGIAQHVDRSSTASGVQVDASDVLTPTHTLRGGAVFWEERTSVQTTSLVLPAVGGVQTSDQPFAVFDSHGKTGVTYGAYLQDAWRVTPTLTVNGGARLDYVRAFLEEWQLSPRLNAVWQPTPATAVHAGYARYFTPPRLEFVPTRTLARFTNTTAEASLQPNSPPRAERAHYFDVGITYEIVAGLKAGLDAYYKPSQYHLDEGQFGAPVFLTPFNYHKSVNYGVELSTSFVTGDFSGYGNLAAAQQEAKGIVSSQASFSTDDLAYIHDHWIVTDHSQLITASAGLAYTWLKTRFAVDLLVGSGLRRSVHHPNDATNPPYQQLNLSIARPFVLPGVGKLIARFDVINALDNNYVLRNGTGVGVFAKQFGPPLGFYGGLKKAF